MAKLAVIGDKSSVLALKAAGVDVFTPHGADEARQIVETLARKDYGIIFITEEIAEGIQETIARYDGQFTPAVIPIPSSQGTLGLGMKRINENLEKAVGFNLFREEEQREGRTDH